MNKSLKTALICQMHDGVVEFMPVVETDGHWTPVSDGTCTKLELFADPIAPRSAR